MEYKYEEVPSFDQSFIDPSLTVNKRINFTKKVFSIVSIQLTFTALLTLLAMKIEIVNTLCVLLWIPSIIGCIVSACWLQFSTTAHQQFPKNYILLFVFTLSEAISVGSLCANLGEDQIVLQAFVLTCGIVLALTTYALTTKKDITMMGGSFFLFLASTLLMGVSSWLFSSPFLYSLYSAGGAMILGFYLIYDIQLIMGNKQFKISIDHYILGSLMLYTDIIRLFIKIIQFLGESKDKKE